MENHNGETAETVDLKAGPEAAAGDPKDGDMPGVIPELGTLPAGAVVSLDGLAKIFRRSPKTIRRAVKAGALPPPVKIFGGMSWTIGTILHHLENRLARAAQEAEREARRLAQHSA